MLKSCRCSDRALAAMIPGGQVPVSGRGPTVWSHGVWERGPETPRQAARIPWGILGLGAMYHGPKGSKKALGFSRMTQKYPKISQIVGLIDLHLLVELSLSPSSSLLSSPSHQNRCCMMLLSKLLVQFVVLLPIPF